MENSNSNLTSYALREGKIVHVDEVSNGLACNCTCPSCNAQMIAKHGNVVKHHFAHYNAKPCSTGYQTAIHMRAKDILARLKYITLPKYEFEYYDRIFHIPSMSVEIVDVVLEKRIDNIIPDVIVKTKKGQLVLVEIYVTHKIDEEKEEKIKQLDIPTIEIDLSKFELNDNLLVEAMTSKMDEYGKWVYFGKENAYKKKIESLTEILTIKEDGSVDCPLLHNASSDKNHPLKGYAKECGDIYECWYLLKKTQTCVYCMGKQYFHDFSSLKYPFEKRQEFYLKNLNLNYIIEKIKKSLMYFASFPLKEREGKRHPINKLEIQHIVSIEPITDTGCNIPRLKVVGVDVNGEIQSFYITILNSIAANWIWMRKWYKDFAETQKETIALYKKSYDHYNDRYKIKFHEYFYDAAEHSENNKRIGKQINRQRK